MNAHVSAATIAAGPATETPPRLLFVGVAGDPCADRIVADMARHGAVCAVMAPFDSFAARTRFVQRVFAVPDWRWRPLRALGMARRLEEIVEAWRPDLILPIDELSSIALRDARLVAQASEPLRRLLATSLGEVSAFGVASSRRAMMKLAREIGVRAPRERDAESFAEARDAAAEFGLPVVLKRDLSCGGGGVAIVSEERGLSAAHRRLWFSAFWRRSLGSIPGYRPSEGPALTLQEFIPGKLAYRVSACVNGRELEGVDLLVDRRGPFDTRPSSYVRGLENAEMADGARRMIAAMKISGVVSFDFVLSPHGDAYLIEMNPRPVHSGHLGALFGHDVHAAALFRRAGLGALPEGAPPETVALFPRAFEADPDNPDLKPGSKVLHDIPWDDPEALDAYREWLEHRHPHLRPRLGELFRR
jgi:hypothetical protein